MKYCFLFDMHSSFLYLIDSCSLYLPFLSLGKMDSVPSLECLKSLKCVPVFYLPATDRFRCLLANPVVANTYHMLSGLWASLFLPYLIAPPLFFCLPHLGACESFVWFHDVSILPLLSHLVFFKGLVPLPLAPFSLIALLFFWFFRNPVHWCASMSAIFDQVLLR